VALQIRIDEGPAREVTLTRYENRYAAIWIDGKEHRALLRAVGAAYEICLDDHTEPIWLFVDRDSVFIHAFGRSWRTEVTDPSQRSLLEGDQTDVATAPMPGIVISVGVSPGEAVTAGQPLLVIESMKMQSEIVAWRDGIVDRVHLQVGDAFDRGAGLVELVALDEDVAAGAEPVTA
jgi:acetyl/propionyl-CoA carboxylase alpha subunit